MRGLEVVVVEEGQENEVKNDLVIANEVLVGWSAWRPNRIDCV